MSRPRLQDLLDPGGDRVGDHLEVSRLHPAGRRLDRRVLLGGGDQPSPAGRHVNHGLRGAESEEDARFCRERLGAHVIESNSLLQSPSEAALRDERYRLSAGRGLRATGHTASDQVETVLYRLVSSGRPGAIKAKREDGVVRPLLVVTREETQAYCRAAGLPFRVDSSNADTRRGLIRDEILPLLRRLHPGADASLLALAEAG